MSSNVIIEVKRALRDIPSGTVITAGLSGGADSVCLLLSLLEVSEELGIIVKAVHVNHSLRGEESDSDQRFCEELCQRLGVPLTLRRVFAGEYAREQGKSLEEAARILRYNVFEECGGDLIATAHNLNDNGETVLFNMARGSGLKGLCGIPARRGNLIRPLLRVSRQEIEDYLKEKGQGYVTDSTNLVDDCSRNIIRHRIMPVMSEINSGFLENIRSMTEILNEENSFIEKMSYVPDERAAELDDAPRRRYIIRRLRSMGIEPDSGKVIRADDVLLKGGRQQICGNLFAYKREGALVFERLPEAEIYKDFSQKAADGVNFFPDGRKILWKYEKVKDIHNLLTYYAVDCDKIQGDVVIRTRREGDRIILPGESFHRRLRKLYNSRKIPPHKRDSAVIIADGRGILFAEHIGVTALGAADENTKNIRRIEITDDK